MQDMGYYPFGSKFFSDLVHYVRSGDFVQNLLRESHDLNEYAFALGALAHYAADTQGHSIAVNRAVAIEYPKLARKYRRRRHLCETSPRPTSKWNSASTWSRWRAATMLPRPITTSSASRSPRSCWSAPSATRTRWS